MRGHISESGASAVEYGVLTALVVTPIIGVASQLGERLSATFQQIVDALPAPALPTGVPF